jgi:hypothetical protein
LGQGKPYESVMALEQSDQMIRNVDLLGKGKDLGNIFL